jgi:hypothetical protein
MTVSRYSDRICPVLRLHASTQDGKLACIMATELESSTDGSGPNRGCDPFRSTI